jgi:hypothetical protein
LQQLQLHEANEKVRTLEEIVHVLAQQQHSFERSIGPRQNPYQSPPRLTSGDTNDFVASDSECEEFFDAFEEERLDDLLKNDESEVGHQQLSDTVVCQTSTDQLLLDSNDFDSQKQSR